MATLACFCFIPARPTGQPIPRPTTDRSDVQIATVIPGTPDIVHYRQQQTNVAATATAEVLSATTTHANIGTTIAHTPTPTP